MTFRSSTHFYETLPPRGGKARSTGLDELVSVALFLALRRAGITRHPTLWSPDFPLRAARTIVKARVFHAQRLPGRLPVRILLFPAGRIGPLAAPKVARRPNSARSLSSKDQGPRGPPFGRRPPC